MNKASIKKAFQALRDKLGEDNPNALKACSETDLEALSNLCCTISTSNAIYQPEELEDLAKTEMPEMICDFYSVLYPESRIDIGGDINLLPFDQMIAENTERTPGALLVKYGYLTFAVTTGGNAICFDLNSEDTEGPRILIADHAIFSGKEISVYTDDGMVHAELSREIAEEYTSEINETFMGFIEMLANDEIDDVEDFME